SQEAARCCRAESDNGDRLHQRAFDIEPDLAALDLISLAPLVQPPLASHLMLEMFHRIGDENLRARNSCIFQCPAETAPRRADKRLAGEIFLVTRLLADEHEVGRPASLAWHRLRRVLVERTARAFVLRLGKLRQRSDGRRKVEIELRFLSHRALQSLPPCRINARDIASVRRGANSGSVWI